MRMPKTIKGYVSLMRQIEKISPMWMSGFDELPQDDQDILTTFDAEISNGINSVESFKE